MHVGFVCGVWVCRSVSITVVLLLFLCVSVCSAFFSFHFVCLHNGFASCCLDYQFAYDVDGRRFTIAFPCYFFLFTFADFVYMSITNWCLFLRICLLSWYAQTHTKSSKILVYIIYFFLSMNSKIVAVSTWSISIGSILSGLLLLEIA